MDKSFTSVTDKRHLSPRQHKNELGVTKRPHPFGHPHGSPFPNVPAEPSSDSPEYLLWRLLSCDQVIAPLQRRVGPGPGRREGKAAEHIPGQGKEHGDHPRGELGSSAPWEPGQINPAPCPHSPFAVSPVAAHTQVPMDGVWGVPFMAAALS